MTSLTIEQWEMATDMIALLLFAGTLAILVLMTIRYRRMVPKEMPVERPAGFNEELVQMMKQPDKNNGRNSDLKEQSPNAYENVEKLVHLGLSAEQIAEKVSVPKSEIELLIRLKKFGLKSPQEKPPVKAAAQGKSSRA